VEQAPDRLRDRRGRGIRDDRGKRPVDVEKERRALRLGDERLELWKLVGDGGQSLLVSPTMAGPRLAKLAVVGSLAGAFSALFGVGGGTVIVPLLIFWLSYGEHEATGTSLAAIAAIAALGVVGHGAYGNVDVAKGLLVGLPAVGGVIAGTSLQQRLSGRAVSLLFACLLVAVAVDLLIT
jgi:uncharacterized membrane protein YfcA